MQAEKGQDRQNDDDQANQVNQAVHSRCLACEMIYFAPGNLIVKLGPLCWGPNLPFAIKTAAPTKITSIAPTSTPSTPLAPPPPSAMTSLLC